MTSWWNRLVRGRTSAVAIRPTGQAPDAQVWSDIRRTLERILIQNIVPFWYPRALDLENGGYLVDYDARGQGQGPKNKTLVSQAGTLWFFAHLARSPYAKAEHLKAARHGYEFLRDRLWDEDFGGFFWEVDPSGREATMSNKHVYGQASALYALCEYATATSDSAATTLATRLFEVLEERAYDAVHGGYFESFKRDWSPPSSLEKTYLGTPFDQKTLNTHLHMMKSGFRYYLATSDARARDRLYELLLIQTNAVVRKTLGACTDRYQLDWTPVLDEVTSRVSYGFDLASIPYLTDVCTGLGMPYRPLSDLFRALFDYALQWGWDREQGGFYEAGSFLAPADQRDKVWWVQAEALVSAFEMYRQTQELIYFDCFSRTLDWIVKRQVDWDSGEWFATVDERGAKGGDKGQQWKTPYHAGRATILCLEQSAAFESA